MRKHKEVKRKEIDFNLEEWADIKPRSAAVRLNKKRRIYHELAKLFFIHKTV